MAAFNVIDVSKWNNSIDWRKAKPNIDGVIMRVGYRGYADGSIVIDSKFYEYYDGCRKNRIDYGIYFFTQAKNYSEGQRERAFVINTLSALEYKPTFPIFIDTEWRNNSHNGRADNIGVDERTAAIIGFCETMENAGYYAGVYRSTSWFNSKVNDDSIKRFCHWVADYRTTADGRHYCGYDGKYSIWQYLSTGRVNGINGNVDLNYCYIDFPKIIINGGFNGFPKKTETPQTEPIPENPAADPIEIETPPAEQEPTRTDGDDGTFSDGFIKSLIKAILKYLINIFEK